jgi:hypothetical protein
VPKVICQYYCASLVTPSKSRTFEYSEALVTRVVSQVFEENPAPKRRDPKTSAFEVGIVLSPEEDAQAESDKTAEQTREKELTVFIEL